MKAIINGRRYNTEAPRTVEVASDSWGYASDFHHWTETLYRTGHGRWFLVGSGGPMSRYGRAAEGGGWCGSSDNVIPMSSESAMIWLEEHGEVGALEEYFESEIEEA